MENEEEIPPEEKPSESEPEQTESSTSVTINACNFETTVWDGQALEAVTLVARALLNLSELFKAQNINVTGISIGAKP